MKRIYGEVLIGIWPGHDLMDFAIRAITHGTGTHAAFICGDEVFENFFPQVRCRKLEFDEKVELYRIEGSGPAEWEKLMSWIRFELNHPEKYSVRDLFRFWFNMKPVDGRSCFCSQWVLKGIRINLAPRFQPLVRLQYRDFASPRDLRISPRLVKVF